jgi:HK97 family phage portal protein
MSRFGQAIARAAMRLAPANVRAMITSYDIYRELLAESRSASGAVVTPETSMRVAAVYSCVKVLSEDIAALPLPLYRRQPRGREVVTDHWLAELLRQPNTWQTGMEFREMQQAHLELCGKFFALKTVVRGEVRELLPIPPHRMQVTQGKDWQLKYVLTWPDGTREPVPPELVYHVRGLTLNGFDGISPIEYQRELVGLTMQLVNYGSRLFRNGAMIGGTLEHPGQLSEPAAKRLKESFEEKYAGADNAHKVILLEEGAKFTITGMKADEAQFLESRKMSRSEIAGIYRVPPHLIGDLERSTFSNVEQQTLNYAICGLLPRVRRIEARMAVSLLQPRDRASLYVEHNMDGLLRGDYAARMRGYQVAVLSGWMTRNQVRELENMNPGPADLDVYLAPMNMTSSTRIDPNQEDQVPGNPAKTDEQNPGMPTALQERLRAI